MILLLPHIKRLTNLNKNNFDNETFKIAFDDDILIMSYKSGENGGWESKVTRKYDLTLSHYAPRSF